MQATASALSKLDNCESNAHEKVCNQSTKLVIFRGLPGSGKTTAARGYLESGDFSEICAADDFFLTEDGRYLFRPDRLKEAHSSCQQKTRQALTEGKSVGVHNTFTTRWEMQVYIEMAEQLGAVLSVIDIFDGGCDNEELLARNEHNVPHDAIERMRSRYERDWESADPLPPWQRKSSKKKNVDGDKRM